MTRIAPGKLAVFAACFAAAAARADAEPPAVEAAAATSTAAATSLYYRVEKLRDPFLKSSASGAVKPKAQTASGADEFSIHNLSLRAVMKDGTADFALFNDMGSGGTYIFRANESKDALTDPRGRTVRGVSGSIEAKKKLVRLKTPDGDVQVFKLGEDEKVK